MLFAGMDEANKGEALNSVVLVCCYTKTPWTEVPLLPDSKRASKADLKDLNELLTRYDVNYQVEQIPPQHIMKGNLNELILAAQKKLILKVNPDVLFVDGISSNCERLRKVYCTYFKGELTVENRLDEKNSLVSLASLIAMRRKFENLKALELQVNSKVGSGNLFDPVTVRYIKSNYPNVVGLRRSWSLRSLNL